MPAKISVLEHWAFGITIVIGGQFFSWNLGLSAGFGAFLLNYCFVALGYLSLCCCLGEMSSTLQAPFSGALFCFTRAAFGRTFGFFVAALEVLEYVGYVASTLLVFGEQLTFVFGTDHRFEPLWWFLFFVVSLPVYLKGMNWFWKVNVVCALLMILQLVVYFILAVTTPTCSMENTYSPQAEKGFKQGFDSYARALPDVIWLFVGVEGLTLANEELFNHQHTHKGMILCCLTLMVTALLSIFGSVTNTPIDSLSTAAYPLNDVLEYYGASSRGATWFSIIPTFATSFGFIFLYATLINSLARSAVLPEWLGNPPNEQPLRSMLIGSVLVYLITVLGWVSTDIATITGVLFSVYQISAVVVYCVQIAAFIVMRTSFANLGRTWNSPLGIPGAVMGLMVFALVFLCLALKPDHPVKWLFIALWFVAVAVYYRKWGRYAKPASEEEIRAMFRMHTMRINIKKAQHSHTYRECQACSKVYCTGCRKKGHSQHQHVITRLMDRFTAQNFTCWNCNKSTELNARSIGSVSGSDRASARDESGNSSTRPEEDEDLEEELEMILMARSLDKKCVVAGCSCRNLKFKSQEKMCECGHLAIYHESTEEALGLIDHAGSWKRVNDIAVLEEILYHTEKAKGECMKTFAHKIDSLKHRIAYLKQQASHETKMAEKKANKDASAKAVNVEVTVAQTEVSAAFPDDALKLLASNSSDDSVGRTERRSIIADESEGKLSKNDNEGEVEFSLSRTIQQPIADISPAPE